MKTVYDVAVIGAGIVGLSTAYNILKTDSSLKVCVIEKENSFAKHQTGNNSGVIHSGIYYKPGSEKARNCIKGYKQLLEFCRENEIRHEICGKIIVAVDETELSALERIYNRGIENGLTGLKKLDAYEIKELEPHSAGIEAVFVPQTGIIDYKDVSKILAEKISSMKGEFKYGFKLRNVTMSNDEVTLLSNEDKIESKFVIGCAGLYSDKVAQLFGLKVNYRIIPFRGEYYKLTEDAKKFVRNLIYPVPDPSFPFLGVHFTRMIDGELEAGPNAVLAFKREGYLKSDFNLSESMEIFGWKGARTIFRKYWKTGLGEMHRSLSKNAFVNALKKLLPAISSENLVPAGAGVRAQACSKDGTIIDDFLFLEEENFINVCNAPSPAATSSLSIGQTISEKYFNKNIS